MVLGLNITSDIWLRKRRQKQWLNCWFHFINNQLNDDEDDSHEKPAGSIRPKSEVVLLLSANSAALMVLPRHIHTENHFSPVEVNICPRVQLCRAFAVKAAKHPIYTQWFVQDTLNQINTRQENVNLQTSECQNWTIPKICNTLLDQPHQPTVTTTHPQSTCQPPSNL